MPHRQWVTWGAGGLGSATPPSAAGLEVTVEAADAPPERRGGTLARLRVVVIGVGRLLAGKWEEELSFAAVAGVGREILKVWAATDGDRDVVAGADVPRASG